MNDDPTAAPKILIVDDEAEIRALLMRSLESIPCKCSLSSSTSEAINLIMNDRYSLVMSDVFAVVDTLDAMTSDRPYRKALSFEAARQEVARCSGTQFDPKVAEALLSVGIEAYREIHDLVNNRRLMQDRCDVLCPT